MNRNIKNLPADCMFEYLLHKKLIGKSPCHCTSEQARAYYAAIFRLHGLQPSVKKENVQ